MDRCLLCNQSAVITRQDNSSRTIYNCGDCGVYVVSDLIIDSVKEHTGEVRSYLRQRNLAGNRDTILISFEKAKLDKGYLQMTVEQIVDRYPKSFLEQMEMSLRNLAMLSRYPGDEIRIDTLASGPIFYLKHYTFEALSFIIKAMQQGGFIDVNYYGASFFPCSITINPKGWDVVSGENKEADTQSTRPRALLIYNPAADTGETVKSAVQKAAKESKAQLVTSCALSNESAPIGAELTANIKMSDIVIVDFSAARPECFYALGVARMLNKRTLLLCSEKDCKKQPLDPGWASVSCWQEEKNLQVEVYNFIKACE